MPGFLVGMLELAPLCMQAVRVSTSTLTPSSPSVLCMSSSAWAVLSVCLSLPGSPPPSPSHSLLELAYSLSHSPFCSVLGTQAHPWICLLIFKGLLHPLAEWIVLLAQPRGRMVKDVYRRHSGSA